MITQRCTGANGRAARAKAARPRPQTPTKRASRCVLALALAVCALPCPARAAKAKSILILNSYHPGYDWSDNIMAGMRSVFDKAAPGVELYCEYMDTKRYEPAAMFPVLEELYRGKYRGRRFDVIVVSDDNALDFLLARRAALFGDAPVVFCGINKFQDSLLAGHKGITGVTEEFDLKGTLELALRLHPRTDTVALLSDSTQSGKINLARARLVAQGFQGRVRFVELVDPTTDDLRSALGPLGERAIVLHLSYYRDSTGLSFSAKEGINRVLENSPLPMYTAWDFLVQDGVLGGLVVNGRLQGELAAGMAVRVLRGQSPESIAIIRESPNTPMFDYGQMRRFGIGESDLPQDAIIVNRPHSFYARYRRLVWSVAAVIGGLSTMVALLSLNVIRRRRAEAGLRALFEGVPDSVLIHDRQGRILDCNESAYRTLGYTRQELRGMTTRDIDAPGFAGGFSERLGRQLAQGGYSCEGVHVTKDGRHIRVDINTSAFTFRGKTAVLAVCRDITERKRTQEELAKAQALLLAAVEQTPAGIVIADAPDVRIRLANSAALAIRGQAQAPLTDIPVDQHPSNWQVYHADGTPFRAEDLPLSQAVLYGRTLKNVDAIIRRTDGEPRWVLANSAPIRNAQGEIIAGVVVFPDITDRKRAEEERRKLQEQIQHAQKLESLGVLAGGIAHDFNNLLVGILGNADLALLDLPPSSPARGGVGEIKRAAIRASELTNQMLAYSGKGRFVIEPINLNEVVEEMAHLLKVSIPKKVVLRLDFTDPLPAVQADAAQIRQVVMNLITNASDAIGDASGTITVHTAVCQATREYLAGTYLDDDLPAGAYTFLEVRDTGCGMDPQTQARIFDPFFSTKFAGRGLGLAGVLGIVRGHRGALKVDSRPGEGTTFRVLFPATQDAARPSAPAEDTAGADGWRGTGTVLVVDDEEAVRTVAGTMLRRGGFRVLTAANGPEGAQALRRHAGEVVAVLLDMTMPQMSGEETFRQMRDIQPDLKVILSSGYNEQDAISRFAAEGLAGFIQKPFQLHALLGKLREILDPPEG